ncbi:nuclear pore complex protein Nup160 isoform X2 [Hoplias malabaricus]|uniref:nuclear pore complex protein Nup160 isoform X2 n=1 Tax=Hoplias malabaricus TaxID=27720 RepID=UPI0034630093
MSAREREAEMATLERSSTEIQGFQRERETVYRSISVNLGVKAPPGGAKLPDSAGGYSYEESGSLLAITSNRFIHWSTSGDTVELVEQSLDINLLNNAIRLKFLHCSVLPGGVHIHETFHNVFILIVTKLSVHRLVLPHPTRMYRSELVTELQMQSVFTDVGKLNIQDEAHTFLLPQSPTASATWISPNGHAHFALAPPTGGITVVTLPPQEQEEPVSVLELKQSSVMQRLAGWMPSAIRGEQSPCDLAVSMAAWPLEDDTFVFALCHDHKLRVWSFKEQQCVLVADLLEYVPVGRSEMRCSPGSTHRLRVCFSGSTGLCVSVYLAVPNRGQFCVLQLVASDNGRYSLEHISTLFSTQETLVDFALTSTDIWGLWVDDDNQTVVKHINFEHNTAGMWNQVFVQPPPEEEVHIGPDQDPRETYLDVLFSPLHFSAEAIVKALQIYKRGTERLVDVPWDALKKEVTLAVENELQSSVTEFEFSQEDYRMLQVEFWSKFYACCLQYQEALSTPLALHYNQATAMVCLLKKGSVSFLLPSFAVDHLYLTADEYLFSEEETPVAEGDPDLSSDILQLVQCLRMLSDCVQGEMACEMERALELLLSPERAAEQVLENLLANDRDSVMEDITNKLQDVRNPLAAMSALLRELDLETDMETGPEATAPPAGQSLSVRLSLSQLYGSSVAVSVICQAVSQMAMTRALMCRDLLILQHLYLRLGDTILLAGSAQSLQLQQDLIPRCSLLLCCYYLLKQLSHTLASPVPLDTLDANLQHLSVLELSDSAALAPNRSVLNPQTVVELFYQNVGRKVIISQLFGQRDAQAAQSPLHWPQLISGMVTLLGQLLWPSNPSFLFPECMMGNCQYTQLQEYVRLIGPWCQANVGSCRFVLGQSYLACGEGQKALQCFQEAAPEVEKEEFLMKLTSSEEEAGTTSPCLLYYNKVLRLLEDVGLPELVIHLATLAISEAVNDERSQAALWTRIFKHHLDLGHNREAYEALTQNPDPSRQLDCLRQLVVVLCERAQLQDLVQFPYVNLHEEVVSIIESRARAVDLMTHNYYELLYAFHINRHNYRKAGTVMFEYGMRLGREVRTLQGLQKQVNCFLAALNCLRLIRPEYAWIIQPSSGPASDRPGASPKRTHEGELAAAPVSRQIEILELKDLEKEYILSRCRLTLAQQHPPSAAIAGSASAAEMVSLLVQAGLFDTALSLCQTFNLPLTPVFEGLTYKCIKLQFGGEQSQNEAWNWLAANQLPSLVTTKECSATDEAWRLLASYLEKHPTQNAQHHRCVINRLLSHGVPVPDWLLNAYKEVDAAALLRLYLNYDQLESAAELVVEYVDALLGKGHQYFGIEMPLSATAPLVWLPYTSIDQLLRSLREGQASAKVYEKLSVKLGEYHRLVDQSTKHRLHAH